MAAVVASKVKRQRQLAAEQKNADGTPSTESQLIQRRAASASREAAERRKLSQYYSQVEGYYISNFSNISSWLGPLCFS